MNSVLLSWGIAAAATAGVITRPFKWPEAVWAVAGALLLVALGLLPVDLAIAAVGKGTDVYLFLFGMMLLSEVGRREGLFDWVAVLAVNHAQGSPRKLFLLVYLVGVVITAFLSNDAAAVVLTPAVFAAAKKAKTHPLPLLFVCAFIANAASFVLPISNPANIVLYGNHTPALGAWLMRFTLPSLLSIVATYLMLRWSQRDALAGTCEANLEPLALSASGRVALAGIAVTAVALLTVSAFDLPLGLPTAILGALTALVVLIQERKSPLPMIREISWSVLPLVAALFVLVEMLDHTGVITTLAGLTQRAALHNEMSTAGWAGAAIAFGSNLMNNLPAGLIASSTVLQAHSPERVIDALLIGVDLGPNLSITGSLATILWLNAIRREGEDVGFLTFLKVGVVVMLPALVLALGARILIH
ncbi:MULTISPECIES: arsenic transporter [Paraburkholderia]|uniref:Arsenical pump membrane protein n=2 Tax=Paraburkholderia TaxID=1822464 RepID=A0A7Y9W5Q5_9BURK|nr:arsenic transporter [Paraburkholderia bryophila]NYH14462.1 arsenical pump membrane protein [Paraburkholderia bryophila]NYH27206.1 arsenical pump membrane protein [Paraburkholderia bryophila]